MSVCLIFDQKVCDFRSTFSSLGKFSFVGGYYRDVQKSMSICIYSKWQCQLNSWWWWWWWLLLLIIIMTWLRSYELLTGCCYKRCFRWLLFSTSDSTSDHGLFGERCISQSKLFMMWVTFMPQRICYQWYLTDVHSVCAPVTVNVRFLHISAVWLLLYFCAAK